MSVTPFSPVNPFQNSVQGLQRAQQGVAEAAQQITRITAAPVSAQQTQDLNEPLVNLRVEELAAAANAKALDTADKTIGSLLDIKV